MVYAITQFIPGSIESLTQRCLVDLKRKNCDRATNCSEWSDQVYHATDALQKLRSKILALALTTPQRFWCWPMYARGADDVVERLLVFAFRLFACQDSVSKVS